MSRTTKRKHGKQLMTVPMVESLQRKCSKSGSIVRKAVALYLADIGLILSTTYGCFLWTKE